MSEVDNNAPQRTEVDNNAPQRTEVDNGGFWWGLLGCCIPIVGLVLFLVWKGTKPKTAKSAGIGALVGVILGVLLYIILIVILGLGMASLSAAGYGY